MVFWALTGVVVRCSGHSWLIHTLSLRYTLAFLHLCLSEHGPLLSRVSAPLPTNEPTPETMRATPSYEAGTPNPELPVGMAMLVSST